MAITSFQCLFDIKYGFLVIPGHKFLGWFGWYMLTVARTIFTDEPEPNVDKFEYDSYNKGEPAFLLPKNGSWSWSYLGPKWWRREDAPGDEEYFDKEDSDAYATEVYTNMYQHKGRLMSQHGDTHTHTSTSTTVACNGGATPLLKLYPKCCLTWYAFPSWSWMDPHTMGGQGMGLVIWTEWDVRHLPVAIWAGVPVGFGMANFSGKLSPLDLCPTHSQCQRTNNIPTFPVHASTCTHPRARWCNARCCCMACWLSLPHCPLSPISLLIHWPSWWPSWSPFSEHGMGQVVSK